MRRYSISVEELDAQSAEAGRKMSFSVENHDDIFAIVNRLQSGGAVPAAEAEEFALGLKLFSEVVIRHRAEPLFSEVFGDIARFIKRLKAEAR